MLGSVSDATKTLERGSVEIEIGPEVDDDGKPTAAGWRWVGRKLREPIHTLTFKGPRGREISYITARQVAARLDAVIGPGNWSDSYQVLSTEPWVIQCTLALFGVSKSDCGYSNAPDAEPGEGNYEVEPAKAGYSDAFKRAAVKWGVGRFLYPEIRT